MEAVFFYIFAFITTFCVLFMILQKNPVASAISLVASFFGLAAIYILLDAPFVAALQILVYAGAIMVLFIFVIMLLNLKDSELTIDKLNLKRISVIVIGLALFSFLSWQFSKIPLDEASQFKAVAADFGSAKEVGKLMFSEYVVAFEVIGVLLLVGIVGAILLGRREN
jgi:NADH-quinone oxidoreductase subunit J